MNTISPILDIFKCPELNRTVFFRLFLIVTITYLSIIANPGFFRSDEFYLIDHIQQMGFQHYFSTHLSIQPGREFAFNVRPVALIIQGFILLWLPEYPFLVHLADVLMHGLVAMLLFLAIVRFCGQRNLAWVSSILFILSPLTVYAVAWTAAIMDRLVLLFGLLTFLSAHAYITERRSHGSLLVVFITSLLAMLSKETALVLPAMFAVYWFFPERKINIQRIWAAFGACSVPVVLLMLYRLPQLIDGFKGEIDPGYAPNILNAPKALFGYFFYPFLPFLEEANYSLLQSAFSISAAVVCHIVLCFLIWRNFSFRAVVGYFIGYGLFLVPILSIPLTHMFAYYLYGSGVAFSVGLAALLLSAKKTIYKLIPALLIVVVTLHTIVVQRYFYKHGLCMNNMLTSLKAAWLEDHKPNHMSILTMPGSPVHPLHCYTHGRKYPLEFTILDWSQRKEGSGYIFDCDCLVRKRPEIIMEIKSWGPSSTILNKIANPQPNGTGAFWIKVDMMEEDLGKLEVLLGGQSALNTEVRPGIITANFPPDIYAKVGEYTLEIQQATTGKKIRIGTFVVNNIDGSKPFVVKIGNWGPQTVALNEVPNLQPDGNGALWFEIGNARLLGEVQVIIAGQPALSTSVQEKAITAAFPPVLFTKPGEKEVKFRHVATGQQFIVGKLIIK